MDGDGPTVCRPDRGSRRSGYDRRDLFRCSLEPGFRLKLLVVSHTCATALNQQLYAELSRQTGWDVTLVVPSNWRDEFGRVLPAEKWPGFSGRLIAVPVRRSGNIILHTYRASFAKLIREVDPDAVYVNHEPYAAATAQVYWGNRRAGGRRRPIGFYSCQNILKRYPPPFRWTERWVLRTSAFFFPISTAVRDVFAAKGYAGPSAVLPLAIDPAVYHSHEDVAAARQLLLGGKADDGQTVFGFVGRFVPEKGLRTLLDAFAGIDEPSAHLALVGAGPMESELRSRVAELGLASRVTFAGFVPHTEVPKLLGAIDTLVLPSETQSNWREQFGRVLLEAMACGTPVVGSDSGEIPNLIRDTGGGLIFRERDAADLSERLRELVRDPAMRRLLATSGKDAVAQRYTVRNVVDAMARTIRAALPRDSAPAAAGVAEA